VRRHAQRYGSGGRRHLVLEVLAYANDEAEALGRIGLAVVTTDDDAMVTVCDDGRGTDTRVDSSGHVIRKPVMATKDVRFFDAVAGELLPDGLPRRGMSTVAALSAVLVHENHRAEGAWSQTYRHGIPDAELRAIAVGAPGTSVSFRADVCVGEPEALTERDLHAFAWLRIECREGSQGRPG
jgi:DNA gyrase subunit B